MAPSLWTRGGCEWWYAEYQGSTFVEDLFFWSKMSRASFRGSACPWSTANWSAVRIDAWWDRQIEGERQIQCVKDSFNMKFERLQVWCIMLPNSLFGRYLTPHRELDASMISEKAEGESIPAWNSNRRLRMFMRKPTTCSWRPWIRISLSLSWNWHVIQRTYTSCSASRVTISTGLSGSLSWKLRMKAWTYATIVNPISGARQAKSPDLLSQEIVHGPCNLAAKASPHW